MGGPHGDRILTWLPSHFESKANASVLCLERTQIESLLGTDSIEAGVSWFFFLVPAGRCQYNILNLDDWLTVHHSITFLSPT